MKSLVGFSGFVGSNLNLSTKFYGLYNTKNIKDSYDTNPNLLVYAGVRAEKFLANKDELTDWQQVSTAIDNIQKINPKKLVLISTIDVYPVPVNVNEDSKIDVRALQPYGKNRYKLEQWVKNNVKDYLIVRLPGLYGKNIKKNFIYDLIKIVPSMLNEKKYEELSCKSNLIKTSYLKQDNGFYKVSELSSDKVGSLKTEFFKLGFTALNFTDSRGVFQFYNLKYLWEHINIALDNKITLLNLATEPIKIKELYNYIFPGKVFNNELNKPVPKYDYRTKYAGLFDGKDGYIFSKEKILSDIKAFVEEER